MKTTMLCAALATACLGLAALPDDAAAQRKIDCASQADRRTLCEADTRGGVYLHQQNSLAPCTFGTTWGYTAGAVWVSSGCRGEFVVDIPPVGSGGTFISDADVLRICQNTAAARMNLGDPSGVRVALQPSDDPNRRRVGWSTSGGHSGTCRVSTNGEVVGWTVDHP